MSLRDGGGSGQETPEAGRHTACDPGDQDTARLYCVVEVPCQRWGPCCWPRRQGSCRIPGRMNGAQCGGPAELRAPFVLPRVGRWKCGWGPAGGWLSHRPSSACAGGCPAHVLPRGSGHTSAFLPSGLCSGWATPGMPLSPPLAPSFAFVEPLRSRLSHSAPRNPTLISVPSPFALFSSL